MLFKQVIVIQLIKKTNNLGSQGTTKKKKIVKRNSDNESDQEEINGKVYKVAKLVKKSK